MADRHTSQPTEHERQVAEELAERTGRPEGEPDAPSYEDEIEAERRGTTADQLEREDEEPDAVPDVAYKPKSG